MAWSRIAFARGMNAMSSSMTRMLESRSCRACRMTCMWLRKHPRTPIDGNPAASDGLRAGKKAVFLLSIEHAIRLSSAMVSSLLSCRSGRLMMAVFWKWSVMFMVVSLVSGRYVAWGSGRGRVVSMRCVWLRCVRRVWGRRRRLWFLP